MTAETVKKRFSDAGFNVLVPVARLQDGQNFRIAVEETLETLKGLDQGDRQLVFREPDQMAQVYGPSGDAFLANTIEAGDQGAPAITALTGGGFVVTWESSGIKAQVFGADGVKLGTEFLVNTTAVNSQSRQSVAGLANGGFVAVWESPNGTRAQLFDALGNRVGAEFSAPSDNSTGGMFPTVAALAGGGFIVAWTSFGPAPNPNLPGFGLDGDQDGLGIRAQLFGSTGFNIGGPFLVNTSTANSQELQGVGALENGGFVVAWSDRSGQGGDTSGFGVKAQRFDAAGNKVGPEFLVNTETLNDQHNPTVAGLPGGGFVVTWMDISQQGGDTSWYSVRSQLFDASGGKLGSEIVVNTGTLGHQFLPKVTALPNGGYLIVWTSAKFGDMGIEGVFAQAFDTNGARIGLESAAFAGTPFVTVLTNGTLVGVGDGSDSNGRGVRGQFYSLANSAQARDDAAATAENTSITANVFVDNGAGPDTDSASATLTVTAVQGQPAAVGQPLTLTSGAIVTLNADGTFSYNPNGAFNYLVSPATGAATGAASSVVDSFTYTLNGEDDATVSVTVTGIDGAGDQLRGSAGNDTLTGTTQGDFFNLRDGGDDSASGGDGDDGFYFGGAYTNADVVDGGAGVRDQIGLQGDYSGGVSLGSLLNTELVVLLPGNDARFGDTAGNLYDYVINADAGTIVTNNRLTIQANTLRLGEDLTFNGAASSIDFLIYGGLGTDKLTGGSGNDGFFFGQGRFGASDVVNGGAGTMDQLGLQGNFTGGNSITFGASQISGLEFIVLLSAIDSRFGAIGGVAAYDLTMHDNNIAAGQTLIVSANTLKFGESAEFDGSTELDGRFEIYSGDGNDVLRGGAGDDLIFGGGSGDTMTGGGGNDVFAYRAVTDSDPNERDGIGDFNLGDRIDVSLIDANVNLAGVQNFTFVGMNAFSGQAGELRYQNVGGNLFEILGDTNGDGVGDLDIFLVITDGHTLTLADFIGVTAQQGGAMQPAASPEPDMALGSAHFAGSASKYLDIAAARDFGESNLLHITYDLDTVSTSHDLLM